MLANRCHSSHNTLTLRMKAPRVIKPQTNRYTNRVLKLQFHACHWRRRYSLKTCQQSSADTIMSNLHRISQATENTKCGKETSDKKWQRGAYTFVSRTTPITPKFNANSSASAFLDFLQTQRNFHSKESVQEGSQAESPGTTKKDRN